MIERICREKLHLDPETAGSVSQALDWALRASLQLKGDTMRQITVKIKHSDVVDWLETEELAGHYENEVARQMGEILNAEITIEDGYPIGGGCPVVYDSANSDQAMGERTDATDAYEYVCDQLTRDWNWALRASL